MTKLKRLRHFNIMLFQGFVKTTFTYTLNGITITEGGGDLNIHLTHQSGQRFNHCEITDCGL